MHIPLTKIESSYSEIQLGVETFNMKLHEKPEKTGYNQFSKSKYVPISYIQMTLDELFFGAWSTENFKTQVVANEIIGSIDLKYYHPELKTWITRTGAASVMIRQHKGANITDISKKITNTLVADYPHLLSSCIGNAARSIGKLFGRDLNRDYEDQFQPVVHNEEQQKRDQVKPLKAQIMKNLKKYSECEGAEELKQRCVNNKTITEYNFWQSILTESEALNGTKN